MTTLRRPRAGCGPDGVAAGPWVPTEPAPAGGWPAGPGTIPCVATEWALRTGRAGRVETRPVHSWLVRPAATVADDAGAGRARRFARAWGELLATRAAAVPTRAPAGGDVAIARWVRAGVLLAAPRGAR
jgi:hypothetical protein